MVIIYHMKKQTPVTTEDNTHFLHDVKQSSMIIAIIILIEVALYIAKVTGALSTYLPF